MRHKDAELMQQIADYAEQYYFTNRKSPSTSQIAKAVGIARGTAYKYLTHMSEHGMISYDGEDILTPKRKKTSAPSKPSGMILEGIPCGPLETIDATVDTYVELPTAIFGDAETFILRTVGDSMIEADIHTMEGFANAVYRQMKEYVNKHYISDAEYKKNIQSMNEQINHAARCFEKEMAHFAHQYEKFVFGEIDKETFFVARPAKDAAKAAMENAKAKKEAYEEHYRVFRKLLKASYREIPLGEVVQYIDEITVDEGRQIVVKWQSVSDRKEK